MKALYSKCTGTFILILAFIIVHPPVHAQVVNETTKKKVSIGFGIFTDIWQKVPSGIKTRTINQGINVFGLYNVPLGKSPLSFSIGLGIDVHNVYGNFIQDKSGDTTKLVKIPDTVGFKRSKMTLVYLEVPVEFNLKTKSKVRIGLGFKAGLLVGSSTKYVGDGRIATSSYKFSTLSKIRFKTYSIPNLEQITYGPTLSVGYKWIHVNGYYMLSNVFARNHGPEMTPISVGIVLMPF